MRGMNIAAIVRTGLDILVNCSRGVSPIDVWVTAFGAPATTSVLAPFASINICHLPAGVRIGCSPVS